jgi:hypothetical protein
MHLGKEITISEEEEKVELKGRRKRKTEEKDS